MSRITLDWSVEAQSLIDARHRRGAKALRRLRKDDAELAARLEEAREGARLDGPGWAERTSRWLAVLVEAERTATPAVAEILSELRHESPARMAEVLGAIERGVARVDALDPPSDLVAEHAAVVAAQREYAAAMRRVSETSAGDSVAAFTTAAEGVDRARAAIDATFARLAEAASRGPGLSAR